MPEALLDPPSDRFRPDEVAMAEVWASVLGITDVGLDDDFFSCGGDSLLAITIVAEAQRRGLRASMIGLFKNPTVRGMCEKGRPDAAMPEVDAGDLLGPDDRARADTGAQQVIPATSLQLGLVFESLMSDGTKYVCTEGVDVRRRLDEAILREALSSIVARHEMLRMRFDLSHFSQGVQIVTPSSQLPLTVADFSRSGPVDRAWQTAQVMRDLATPFDPEVVPLLRFHAASMGPASFRLSYAYHHALLDGWSSAGLLHELITIYSGLLVGSHPDLAPPLPYSEFVRLERAASVSAASRRHFESLSRDMPAGRIFSSNAAPTSLETFVPQADVERLTARAAQWQLPIKSLLLAANGAVLAVERGGHTVDFSLLMSGRPERIGSDLTLGLFVNYLPLRLSLRAATWQDAARRAHDAERDLLPHRRFPHARAREIVGDYPFEASFNFVHLRRAVQLVEDGLVERARFSDVILDMPLCVDFQSTGSELVICLSVDSARHDAEFPDRVMSRLRRAVHLIGAAPDRKALDV